MADAFHDHDSQGSVGAALAAARVANGWSQDEISHALKLPLATVVALEHDGFTSIGAPVYVRGFVRSYARLLGLPETGFDAHLRAHFEAAETPTLKPSHGARRSINWGERYSWAFSYLVGTALVLTLIWTIIGFESDSQRLLAERATRPDPQAADVERVPSPDADRVFDAGLESSAGSSEIAALPESRGLSPAPVMASMSPFSSVELSDRNADSSTGGVPMLQLDLAGTSWVEVYGPESQRVAFGTLPPGTHRFESALPVVVLIGNATGATVSASGRSLDFTPFLRANVARFRIEDPGTGPQAVLPLR